jgi:reactive intermediate/imine deaminase
MKPFTLIILCLLLIITGADTFAENRSVTHLNTESHDNSMPFSEAVRVGDILYLSGQMGFHPVTGELAAGGMKAEAIQTMDNIKSALDRLGYNMNDIFKCTVMIADINLWSEFNKVYVTYFEKPYPARSAFGANGLALGGVIEVECLAYVGD